MDMLQGKEQTILFIEEELRFSHLDRENVLTLPDDAINEKYVKGDVRIVTEQARYPLSSIPSMIESDDYELNPEFQRRHRWDNAKKIPPNRIFYYECAYSTNFPV